MFLLAKITLLGHLLPFLLRDLHELCEWRELVEIAETKCFVFEIHQTVTLYLNLLQTDLEKRAYTADISVLFFGAVLIFWLYTRKQTKTQCYYHCAKSNMLKLLCY